MITARAKRTDRDRLRLFSSVRRGAVVMTAAGVVVAAMALTGHAATENRKAVAIVAAVVALVGFGVMRRLGPTLAVLRMNITVQRHEPPVPEEEVTKLTFGPVTARVLLVVMLFSVLVIIVIPIVVALGVLSLSWLWLLPVAWVPLSFAASICVVAVWPGQPE